MSLEIYNNCGFKFFPCKIDKSPAISNWKDPKCHITIEQAKEFQKTGQLIGAWIPSDIIVIDLDKHENHANGMETFKEIIRKYNLKFQFIHDTFFVRTGGGGYHIFLHCIKKFRQGKKAPGIDLKTNLGYVIAAGSPGYTAENDYEPAEIPQELSTWLESCESLPPKKQESPSPSQHDLISIKTLKSILSKLDITKFSNNDDWQQFITASIAAAGESTDTICALSEWSRSDPKYTDQPSGQIENRIKSFKKDGDITIGTFIMLCKQHGISKYMINKLNNYIALSILAHEEEKEETLPFDNPDYSTLAESPEARQFFHTSGNSAAARILFQSCRGNIIYVDGEKLHYVFNGSRWVSVPDMYSIIFTILIRLVKYIYQLKLEGIDKEFLIKITRIINNTNWKRNTLRELSVMIGIYHKSVKWDDITIKESVTTQDGVVDFTGREIVMRTGEREEYRRLYLQYTAEDILNSKEPKKYNEFLKDIFPDKETFKTANKAISLFISGNADYRIFQIWNGNGYNGKSTLVTIQQKVLEGKTTTYDTKMLMPEKGFSSHLTPELAQFQGVNVAFGLETNDSNKLTIGLIKKLTGGDIIKANPKHKDPFEFEATWQLVLACNDLPEFNGHDKAFKDRLLVLPFVVTFVKDDRERDIAIESGALEKYIVQRKDKTKMVTEIMKERPGIINKMIKNYICFRDMDNGIIQESPQCRKHKQIYIADNNSLDTFLAERCIISAEDDLFVPSETIAKAYREFTGNTKYTSSWIVKQIKKTKHVIQSDTQYTEMEKEYFNGTENYTTTEKKQRRGLKNIRLRTDTEIEAYLQQGEKQLSNIDDGIPF